MGRLRMGALALMALMGLTGANETHFAKWAAEVGRVYKTEEERLERYGHWLTTYEQVSMMALTNHVWTFPGGSEAALRA
jgi:hypothetical protein